MNRIGLSKLSLKVIITVLIPTILMGGAFLALFTHNTTSWQYHDKINHQSRLMTLLAISLKDSFIRRDYTQIRARLAEFEKRLGMVRLRWLSKEGKILYDSQGEAGQISPAAKECLLCHDKNHIEIPHPVTYFSEDKKVLRHFTPILNQAACQSCHPGGQKILGFFLADFTETDKRQTLLLTQIIVSSLVTILVIVIILYIALRRMVDYPIREIISRMSCISIISGNLRQIEFSSSDEIGEIVSLINELAERLRYSREELASLYKVTHEIASTLDFEKHILAATAVREAMDTEVEVIYEDMQIKDIMKLFKSSQHIFFPVIDRNRTYLGVITLHEARNVLLDHNLTDIVYARDFYRSDLPSISPSETLERAMDLFVTKKTVYLPVVEEKNGALAGLLEHAHIFRILKSELVKRVGL